MHLILFGFKGVGKSFVGQILSKALQRPLLDTDQLLLEKFSKQSIAELYSILGEEEFRKREQLLIFNLELTTPSIIALGGGAVILPDTVLYLKTLGKMIYLKASFSTIIQRKKTLSFVRSLEEHKALYEERYKIYEAIHAPVFNMDQEFSIERFEQLLTHNGK